MALIIRRKNAIMLGMKTLYILDGMALLYRAFYALFNAPMRTASGLNTSAVFGFTNTLLALLDKGAPSHIVVCLDPSGPTFRHEKYAAHCSWSCWKLCEFRWHV